MITKLAKLLDSEAYNACKDDDILQSLLTIYKPTSENDKSKLLKKLSTVHIDTFIVGVIKLVLWVLESNNVASHVTLQVFAKPSQDFKATWMND